MSPYRQLLDLRNQTMVLRDRMVSVAAQLQRRGPVVDILDAADSVKTAADQMEDVLETIEEARQAERHWRGY